MKSQSSSHGILWKNSHFTMNYYEKPVIFTWIFVNSHSKSSGLSWIISYYDLWVTYHYYRCTGTLNACLRTDGSLLLRVEYPGVVLHRHSLLEPLHHTGVLDTPEGRVETSRLWLVPAPNHVTAQPPNHWPQGQQTVPKGHPLFKVLAKEHTWRKKTLLHNPNYIETRVYKCLEYCAVWS